MRFDSSLQLCALAGCLVAVLSCQSDAEKKFEPDWSKVSKPGSGPNECEPAELSRLGPDDPTVFGATTTEMLAALPLDASSPFFWVAYDELDTPVSYSPGVSETRLALTISAR